MILKKLKFDFTHLSNFININVFKTVLYSTGGILLFIAGVISYGVLLNQKSKPLKEVLAEKGIEEIDKPYLLVEKKKYTLSFYSDTLLLKSYRVNFGRSISKPKLLADDGATPTGEYVICKKDSNYKYHKFMKINYPNMKDALNALREGFVSQQEFDSLKFEINYKQCPGYNRNIGGNIGIHGIGEYNSVFKNLPFSFNWTDGSIALSNEDLDELYEYIPEGTLVVIK